MAQRQVVMSSYAHNVDSDDIDLKKLIGHCRTDIADYQSAGLAHAKLDRSNCLIKIGLLLIIMAKAFFGLDQSTKRGPTIKKRGTFEMAAIPFFNFAAWTLSAKNQDLRNFESKVFFNLPFFTELALSSRTKFDLHSQRSKETLFPCLVRHPFWFSGENLSCDGLFWHPVIRGPITLLFCISLLSSLFVTQRSPPLCGL